MPAGKDLKSSSPKKKDMDPLLKEGIDSARGPGFVPNAPPPVEPSHGGTWEVGNKQGPRRR